MVDRVIELAVGVGKFLSAYKKFKPFGEFRIAAVALGQRRHLYRVVCDEGRLYEFVFAIFTEDGINQLAFSERRVSLDVEVLAYLTELVFIHSCDIHSCIFLDCLKHRKPPVWRLEVNLLVSDCDYGCTVKFDGDSFQHLFHKFHHPDVILVCHIDFHTGEFRIMCLVHSFVAEILGELIHSVIASYDESLKVELVGNSQVKRNVKGVVVGDERSGGRTSRNALEDRCFNFKTSGFVEIFPHRGNDLASLDESISYRRIYDKVNISLAIFQLRI